MKPFTQNFHYLKLQLLKEINTYHVSGWGKNDTWSNCAVKSNACQKKNNLSKYPKSYVNPIKPGLF